MPDGSKGLGQIQLPSVSFPSVNSLAIYAKPVR